MDDQLAKSHESRLQLGHLFLGPDVGVDEGRVLVNKLLVSLGLVVLGVSVVRALGEISNTLKLFLACSKKGKLKEEKEKRQTVAPAEGIVAVFVHVLVLDLVIKQGESIHTRGKTVNLMLLTLEGGKQEKKHL